MFVSSERPRRGGLAAPAGGALPAASLALGCALALAFPLPGSAQDGSRALYEECTDAGTVTDEECADAVHALEAIHGGLGFLLSAGGPLPSSPSTAGRRLATQPRIVVDGGFSWTSFRHPDLTTPPGIVARRNFVLGGRATVVVGLFEGISPLPGVGGVLSLDAVGQGKIAWLSASEGFSDSMTALAGGFRLGVVRESFSLPGITVSALVHRGETTRYGASPDETGTRVIVRPTVRSLRIIAGKDLLAVGLSGGIGWDWYRGSGRVEVERVVPGPLELFSEAGPRGIEGTRRYLFLGANLTWLVAQLSGEISLSRDRSSPLDEEGTGAFRPGGTEVQGAFTVRITY